MHGGADALGITSKTDRIRTAQAVVDVLNGIASGDDHTAVAVLAVAAVPTSAEAMGRSMKTVGGVTERLYRMNTGLVDSATALTGEHQTAAQAIAHTLAAKAGRDELVTDLPGAIDGAERAATELLGRAATRPAVDPPVAPPVPRPPDPPIGGEALAPSGQKLAAGSGEARVLLHRLLAEVDSLEELDVRWKKG